MRNGLGLYLLAVAALWVVAVSAHGQGTGVISGRVFDAKTGLGLGGVEILLSGGGRTLTDPDGYYWLPGVAAGRIKIECRGAVGYALKTEDLRKVVELEKGSGLDGIDFPLRRGVAVHGLLLNDQGRPVSGAKVEGRWPGPNIEGVSRGDGTFVLDGFAPWTEFRVQVETPGLVAERTKHYDVGETDLEGLVVQLYRAGRVRGRLVDADGRALQGIDVELTRHSNSGNLSMLGATTDARGRFAMDRLLPGEYVFSVKVGDGREQKLFRGMLEEGQLLENLTLVYDPSVGLTISGRVLDSEGNGLGGVGMAIMSPTMQTHATTDKDGYYVAHDLEEGSYKLIYLEYDGNMYTKGARAMAGEEQVDIVLTLRPPIVSSGPINAKVVDASTGGPVTSFQYRLKPGVYMEIDPDWRGPNGEQYDGFYSSIGASSWRNVHHPEWSVEIPTYATGDHSLAVRAEGYADFLDAVVAPSDGLVIQLKPESVVEGFVRDPSGNALAGALIYVGEVDWLYPPVPPTKEPAARSDRDGAFSVGRLGHPNATLTVWHEDWGSKTKTVAVSAGQTARSDFKLRPVGSISGYVYLDGEPVRDVSISVQRVEPDRSEYAGTGGACMDDDNQFVLRRLEPGAVNLRVVLDPYDQGLLPKLEANKIVMIEPGVHMVVEFVFESPSP